MPAELCFLIEVVSSINAVLGCVLAQKLIMQLREMLGGVKHGDAEVPNAPFYSENLGVFRILLKK